MNSSRQDIRSEFGFDPNEYEDGTNVLAGTEFLENTLRTTDWYISANSAATPKWEERWLTLRSRFERIVDQYRPVESILVQVRVPAYARDSIGRPQRSYDGHLLLGGGGLKLFHISQLFTKTRQPLFGAFAIRDATGKLMCNNAGDAFALRFGLFRQIDIRIGTGYLHDSRPVPHPQLQELACEATGLLYGLPAKISVLIWRNWLSGFSRGENSSEYLWFDAIFELAWQRAPGGALHAKRWAWFENSSFALIGTGLFPRLHPDWPLPEKLPHEGGYPMAYYSILSDVARASVAAIDEIIELGRTTVGKINESSMRTERSTAVNTAARTDVFISYSHKDDRWREELEKHLKPFVRTGVVKAWSDKQIKPGSKWFAGIQEALARTKVAVLIVSPDFLASDFIDEHELGPLLKEAERGGVCILWFLARACAWEETPLKHYKAVVSPPEKPLVQMRAKRDAVWVSICQEIKSAANP